MKTARFLLLVLLAAPLCRADEGTDLADKLVSVMYTPDMMNDAFEAGLKPSLDQMRAQGAPADLVDSIHDMARGFFKEYFKWDEAKPKIVKIYAESFTAGELGDMLNFMQTPVGQKMARKNPALYQQSMAGSMGQLQSAMPEFQQRVRNLIGEYQKSHPQAAPAPSTGGPTITAPKPSSN
ncbi:MAG TPA: DUF2059 domain-containing protein [Opitutaceae bacterium]|jgi:hypothetical protein